MPKIKSREKIQGIEDYYFHQESPSFREERYVVPEGKFKAVYRVVDDDELDSILHDEAIYPRGEEKNEVIFFGSSMGDAEQYSNSHLVEMILVGGEKYDENYDDFMETEIGYVCHGIPSYRARLIGEVQRDGDENVSDFKDYPFLNDIKKVATNFDVDLLDIFYFVKKRDVLPSSLEELEFFYEEEKEIQNKKGVTFIPENQGLENTVFLKDVFGKNK